MSNRFPFFTKSGSSTARTPPVESPQRALCLLLGLRFAAGFGGKFLERELAVSVEVLLRKVRFGFGLLVAVQLSDKLRGRQAAIGVLVPLLEHCLGRRLRLVSIPGLCVCGKNRERKCGGKEEGEELFLRALVYSFPALGQVEKIYIDSPAARIHPRHCC